MTDPRPHPDDAVAHLRMPPHSIEAEQSVLGGLLLDNMAFDKVGDLLLPEHFYRHEHRVIFEAIASLIVATRPADIITVHDELRRRGREAEGIGQGYLDALSQSVPSASNARAYADVVLRKWKLRQIISAADNAATAAFSDQVPVEQQIDDLANTVARLEAGLGAQKPEAMDAIAVRVLDSITAMSEGDDSAAAWSTFLAPLDEIISGFVPGRVYLLGGRPGQGKSSLASWWCQRSSIDTGLKTLYLSQEMGKHELGERAVSSVGKISYSRLQRGTLDNEEWSRLSVAVELLMKSAMHIDEEVGLTAAGIRLKARFVRGLNILVVDYVQLCRGAEEGADSRNSELEQISRAIKTMAKTLGIAVIVLSALGRKVDERKHERPIISDLRDCGALEADADVVMSLWPLGRAIDRKATDGWRLMGMDVLKQRNGPTGAIALEFHGETMSWRATDYTVRDLLSAGRSGKGNNL